MTAPFAPSARQRTVFGVTMREEGFGLAGNPWGDTHDDGGDTRCGVTQATFSKYLAETGQPDRSVFTATELDLMAVYARYWKDAYCDQLPAPLDLAHFDFTFNSTPDVDEETHVTESVKVLQRALGVADDGELGPVTLGAARVGDPNAHAAAELSYRLAFYNALVTENPSRYAGYLHEWSRRVSHIATACGVTDPTGASS